MEMLMVRALQGQIAAFTGCIHVNDGCAPRFAEKFPRRTGQHLRKGAHLLQSGKLYVSPSRFLCDRNQLGRVAEQIGWFVFADLADDFIDRSG